MAGIGNAFLVEPGKLMEVASKFGQQKSAVEQAHDVVKSFGPQVQAGWIGGDADEFAADLGRKLLPKYIEFAAAFAGVELNLTKTNETSSAGDQKAAGMAQQFADTCSQIYP
jgi:WXG100 family type VII secretion target